MDTFNGLPDSKRLPVRHLTTTLRNVTNSYKFYWFLSILEHVRETQSAIIPIDMLLARMVATVWYPVNFYRLSFGKQDQLGDIALELRRLGHIVPTMKRVDVLQRILETMSSDRQIADRIGVLGKYVPYRFLRPFFGQELRGERDSKINSLLLSLANQSFNASDGACLYQFRPDENAIEIHSSWMRYLRDHLSILTDFCLWHLLLYLQKNNPNVPNIAAKLFEPEQRDMRKVRIFWTHAFEHLGVIQCVYSGETLRRDNFSLDHFLPWSFVTHDLLWNIIPAPKYVNSAKSDQLPDFDRYFTRFAKLQFDAFQAVSSLRKERLLEDYVLLFKKASTREIRELSYTQFQETLHDTLAPQLQIAENMGFGAKWSYLGT